ncbi:MAG: bifunctional 4-hydroxy-2-oxoglutarate aldolase/2-dehydro-3-deoxy-phosphogluconate aldolase [Cyanothece sp. SIO2G6]|nr:bifunctional 4-hydroxy-2-oxoglutarate aldolase/2-dehydro-3-deoxy-phosphogluconate aldolase [Cyanothece sp. SIO2G6]
MTPEQWISLLKEQRAIAIIRATDAGIAVRMAETAIYAGMKLIEVTWNRECTAQVIDHLTQAYPDCVIGTGTILSVADLEGAIAAGAKFAFSPHMDIDLIQMGHLCNLPLVPGALSPTEIVTAWRAGATTIKVFPIKTMGGVEYLNCLRQPLGHIPLIPTGGVTLDSAFAFLKAGAIAVGMSSHLFPASLVAQNQWDLLSERAIAFMHRINQQHLL